MSPVTSDPMLWIVPKWPLPADDGARTATVQLLSRAARICAGRNQTLELAVYATPDECDRSELLSADAKSQLGVRRVHWIPSAPIRQGMARVPGLLKTTLIRPRLPLTMQRYSGTRAERCMDELARRPWSAWVYDGLHAAAHSTSSGLYARPPALRARLIYRAHNVEARLWSRKAELASMPTQRALFSWQARRVREFEISLIDQAAAVATVSDEDLAIFSASSRQARLLSVPIGYDFGNEPAPPARGLQLMFLGRLDWAPNREGLHWFLREVWPRARAARPELKLEIAGSGDGEWLARLLSESPLPGVSLLGRIHDVSALYARSLASIVPLFYGSGTRVKVIEAARHGRACISTALGVEGTGLIAGQTFSRSESASDWIQTLSSLDAPELAAMGTRAWTSMRETFDADRAAHRFMELVDA